MKVSRIGMFIIALIMIITACQPSKTSEDTPSIGKAQASFAEDINTEMIAVVASIPAGTEVTFTKNDGTELHEIFTEEIRTQIINNLKKQRQRGTDCENYEFLYCSGGDSYCCVYVGGILPFLACKSNGGECQVDE